MHDDILGHDLERFLKEMFGEDKPKPEPKKEYPKLWVPSYKNEEPPF